MVSLLVKNKAIDAETTKKESGTAKQSCCSMTPVKRSVILIGCGSVLVVIGAVVAAMWPAVFLTVFREVMVLSPTSATFEVWRQPDLPMVSEFYFFNITNVDEILAGQNVSIRVVQMGPYIYEEDAYKTNITWNDNATVSFYTNRTWKFIPELSNGTESDMVTSINPIIVTVAYLMRYESPLIKVPLDLLLRQYHSSMFTTATVSEWLFEGVDDAFIEGIEDLPEIPVDLDIDIPADKFGWFYGRNGSETFDGEYVMNTGASDFSRIGNVELWNGFNRTTFRGECGAVRGSRGELWALEPGQKEIVLFVSDICTYMTLVANREVTVQGVKGVEFAADASLFDNGYHYPERACYCDEVRDRDCVPPGNLNVSSCRYGSPSFVSLPHFYNSDPYYPSKIEGLNPDESLNFRMTMEMYTGIPLGVSAQMQINMLVRHVPFISINNQLPDPDVMVPMFWFRQQLEMTAEQVQQIRGPLNIRDWVSYGFYALAALGVCVLLSGVAILVRKIRRPSDRTPIL